MTERVEVGGAGRDMHVQLQRHLLLHQIQKAKSFLNLVIANKQDKRRTEEGVTGHITLCPSCSTMPTLSLV